MTEKQRILFVCTGNACRSQMAEGLMKHLAGDRFEVFSAGSHPAGYIHPCAVAAMDEIGINIRGQASQSAADYLDIPLDYVVTVCDYARSCMPTFVQAVHVLHWPFPDPAMVVNDPARQAAVARQVRDGLRVRLLELLKQNSQQTCTPS